MLKLAVAAWRLDLPNCYDCLSASIIFVSMRGQPILIFKACNWIKKLLNPLVDSDSLTFMKKGKSPM